MTLSSGIDDEFILIHIFSALLSHSAFHFVRPCVCVHFFSFLSLIVGGLSVKWRHLFYHTHRLLRFEICTHTHSLVLLFTKCTHARTRIFVEYSVQRRAYSVSNWKTIVSARKKCLKSHLKWVKRKWWRERKLMVKMKISQCIWQIYYWKIACAKFTQNSCIKCRIYPITITIISAISLALQACEFLWVFVCLHLYSFLFFLRSLCCCWCYWWWWWWWCSDLCRISIETWIIFLLKKNWYVECCISIAL